VIATIGVLAIDVRETHLIKVRPRGNESIQQTLKRFKRLCQREGLIRDIKRHSYYEKPCERRRRQSRKLARTPVVK
jgi:small subunit ribosomal protein S21